jgi:hypothetical protein
MATQPTQVPSHDVLTAPSAPIRARPNPLLAVLGWELRRALGNRATWILAVILFGVGLLLLGFSDQIQLFDASASFSAAQSPTRVAVQHSVSGGLTRNSLWGLAILVPITLIEFGLFLPFVTADGVSLDLKRHTHELLMTTAVPSWAYVLGRYLASIAICLGLACEYVLAIVTTGVLLHLTQGNVYSALPLPGALVIPALIVLLPTLFVGSLSFGLGVLLPRFSNMIKAGFVFAWIVGGTLLPAYLFNKVRYTPAFLHGNPPAWWTAYVTWEPTGIIAGWLFMTQFIRRLYAIVDKAALSDAAVQRQAHTLEGQMPDLAPYVWPHVFWVAVGVAAVVGVALAFRRFRDVLA